MSFESLNHFLRNLKICRHLHSEYLGIIKNLYNEYISNHESVFRMYAEDLGTAKHLIIWSQKNWSSIVTTVEPVCLKSFQVGLEKEGRPLKSCTAVNCETKLCNTQLV